MTYVRSNMLLREHNEKVMEEIAQANQTNKKPLSDKPTRLLAGVLAETARHNAQNDPRKQAEIIGKVKRYHNR